MISPQTAVFDRLKGLAARAGIVARVAQTGAQS
jgi:hypothetical protein